MDEQALERWCRELPGGRTFLENFFGTCGSYSPDVNYLNYVSDLKLYAPTNRCIRENAELLVRAFYEVTGTIPYSMIIADEHQENC